MYPDTKNKPERVCFDGVIFRRMGGERNYYLSQSASYKERKNAVGLHVAIWQHANGCRVPKGFIVHHIDRNPFNNQPNNLEALDPTTHRRKHPYKHDLEHLSRIRPLTKAWHASAEGKAWHTANGKKSWQQRPLVGHACVVCGKVRKTRGLGRTYCSNRCGWKASCQRGERDKSIQCVICRKVFVSFGQENGRYPNTCSRSCRGKLNCLRQKSKVPSNMPVSITKDSQFGRNS